MIVAIIFTILQFAHIVQSANQQYTSYDSALETYLNGCAPNKIKEKTTEFRTRTRYAEKVLKSKEDAIRYVLSQRFVCDTNESFKMNLKNPMERPTPKQIELKPSSSNQSAPRMPPKLDVDKVNERLRAEWKSQLKSTDLIPHSRIYRVVQEFLLQYKGHPEKINLDDVILFERTYPWTQEEKTQKKKRERAADNKILKIAQEESIQAVKEIEESERKACVEAIHQSCMEKSPEILFNEEEEEMKKAMKASEVLSLQQNFGVSQLEAEVFVQCCRGDMSEEIYCQMAVWKSEVDEMLRKKSSCGSEWSRVFLLLDKRLQGQEFSPTEHDFLRAVHAVVNAPPLNIDQLYEYCERYHPASSSGFESEDIL